MNGRRNFLLGLYQLPAHAEPWKEAKAAGFDLIRVNPKAAEFAAARQHELHAWTAVGSVSVKNRAETESRIRETVTAFKNERSLLFWETEDEPSFQWKNREPRVSSEEIVTTARLIRSLDASRLLYLNHSPTNLVPTLQKYNAGADIVATDIYPVIPSGIRELFALWPNGLHGDLLNPYISQVGRYADKMRQVAGVSRPVFLVLQAFAWENLREKDRDPDMILYPTRHQLRFMSYQSIVHGVNGLIFWGLAFTPPQAPLWTDLKSVATEISQLKDALSAPALSLPIELLYSDTGHSLDRGIESIAKPLGADVLLIAVNADGNPVDVTFTGLQGFRSCQVLFESRTAVPDTRTFRDFFEPFGVHIYRLLR